MESLCSDKTYSWLLCFIVRRRSDDSWVYTQGVESSRGDTEMSAESFERVDTFIIFLM